MEKKRSSKLCGYHSITNKFTDPYSQQSNEIPERLNRKRLESVRPTLYWAKLTDTFWAEALKQEVYIHEVEPRGELNRKTLFQVLNGHVPNIRNMKTFACEAYITNVIPNKYKSEQRASAIILMRNIAAEKMYTCSDPEKSKLSLVEESCL